MRFLFTLIGLASACAAIWFGGPLTGIVQLASDWIRFALMCAAAFVVLIGWLWSAVRRRSAAGSIERALMRGGSSDDGKVLADRMADALAQLKKSYGSTYLYDLPWYVIIGPPGAGKTTALAYSGLRFPVSGAGAGALEGFGGTRYCDWWFAEDAILIDTAGRYTTQDSDAQSDGASWQSFLGLLKKSRPKQPLNGVILAFSIEDMVRSSPDMLMRHAETVRARLSEMQSTLRVDLPVYVLFTKADLLPGFRECFNSYTQPQRDEVWGVTFQTKDRKAQTVDAVGPEFDRLLSHLSASLVDHMDAEADSLARAAILNLPGEMALLRTPIQSFLSAVFQPTSNKTRLSLRGFYFTSGTQEGTPFDQALGAIQRLGDGGPDAAAMAFKTGFLSGKGKSFFLHDLLQKVIFAEQHWVGYSRRAVMRGAILRSLTLTMLMIVTAGGLAALGLSYWQNATLLQQTRAQVQTYQIASEPEMGRTLISDPDLTPVLPLLNDLRALALDASGVDPLLPWTVQGLDQNERVRAAAIQAYSDGLEQMLRPRMILSLENQLPFWDQDRDLAALFNGLKIYMLLGGQGERTDDRAVRTYFDTVWGSAYGANSDAQIALNGHLEAMLGLDDRRALLVGIQADTVNVARTGLSRGTLADLAYALLVSEPGAQTVPTWDPVAGSDGALVWADSASAEPIPGIFTASGYETFLVPTLSDVTETLTRDQWVLGLSGTGAGLQTAALGTRVQDLYAKDFLAAWSNGLSALSLGSMTDDAPSYAKLARLGTEGGSALIALQENVVAQTSLVPLIAEIDTAFAPWQASQIGGLGTRPIDEILGHLQITYRALVGAEPRDPDRVAAALDPLASVRLLLPSTLERLVAEADADIRRHAVPPDLGSMEAELSTLVFEQCDETILPFYPFSPSDRAVALSDFSDFFGPGGTMSRYFAAHLRPHVMLTQTGLRPHPDSPIANLLSLELLAQFERAAQIQSAFFPTGPTLQVDLVMSHVDSTADVLGARLEINNMLVETVKGDVPVFAQWPSTGAGARLDLLPLVPSEPNTLARSDSPWDIMRLLEDANSRAVQGDKIRATFVVGERQITYELQSQTVPHPFALPALSRFECPASLN